VNEWYEVQYCPAGFLLLWLFGYLKFNSRNFRDTNECEYLIAPNPFFPFQTNVKYRPRDRNE
jgi:hypothetical protein